jgi:hypothetical protein
MVTGTAGLDAFTLAPDEWASKVYEIPGEVVAFVANSEQPRRTASRSSSRSTPGPIEVTADTKNGVITLTGHVRTGGEDDAVVVAR